MRMVDGNPAAAELRLAYLHKHADPLIWPLADPLFGFDEGVMDANGALWWIERDGSVLRMVGLRDGRVEWARFLDGKEIDRRVTSPG